MYVGRGPRRAPWARMRNQNRHRNVLCALALAAGAVLSSTSAARAQEELEAPPAAEPDPSLARIGFIEATGAYGVQFGTTDYLPAGSPGQYMHPIVHGFGVGGTLGVALMPGLDVVANYEYTNARSREGSLTGVIDEVQGFIEYHTIVAGLRVSVPVGFGAIQAELAGGVVLPYETELQITYGPALAGLPTPITGTGTRISHYSVGFGGHGQIGYRLPIAGPLYAALNVRLRTFEAENSGETTELRNFVTDFEAQPPTATDATISHGEGAARPTTNSVQDVRGQLAIGAMF